MVKKKLYGEVWPLVTFVGVLEKEAESRNPVDSSLKNI